MKFKHTFHVFVDNFKVIYKQLLYRVVLGVIAGLLYAACLYPLIKSLVGSEAYVNLTAGIKKFADSFFNGEVSNLSDVSEGIKKAYNELMNLIKTGIDKVAVTAVCLCVVHLVEMWFSGLGNYAAAAVINDRMALRANSPFLVTLINNLKPAAIYNAIYAPLSLIYDIIVCTAMFFLLYILVANSIIPFLVAIFLFTLVVVVAIVFKMVFTTDWLPALIRGKMSQKEAFKYTFSRKGKDTLNVTSNFVVLILIIFAMNVVGIICTFGVAGLLTIPASYIILLSFEMVNYFDREQIKYFISEDTVVRPPKEHTPTREEFFHGEDD